MKRLIMLVAIAALLSGTALASPTVKYLGLGYKGTYNFGGSVGNVYAGELKYYASGIPGVTDGEFISFCVEANEELHAGKTYMATVNTAAVNGGLAGGNPDPLSNSTAWLYNSYLDNVIGSSNNTIARDYQMAIWYLEDEIADKSKLSIAAQALVDNALANIGVVNNNIKVLNLEYYDSNQRLIAAQDTLVRVSPVPLPGSVALSGLGLSVVGFLRRRRTL